MMSLVTNKWKVGSQTKDVRQIDRNRVYNNVMDQRVFEVVAQFGEKSLDLEVVWKYQLSERR